MALCAGTASAQPAIPDTPAGHTFKAWFDAFNGGDVKALDAYFQKYDPKGSAAQAMQFRAMSGGFDLRQIVKSERLHIEALVKERTSDRQGFASMDVTDADPAVVTSFTLRALPPGVSIANLNMRIDATTRARVVDSAVADLSTFYVSPDVAKKMTDALRAHEKRGVYDTVTDGAHFADLVTTHLQDVSHDKHLRVVFSPIPTPPPPPDTANVIRNDFRHSMERNNCAFEKAELLPGNIGYLKFNGFGPPDLCGPTASAAMNFLGNAAAIIFDLRDNGGGDPAMVAYISTYLFAEPTHLNDLWTRKDSSTHQFWTLPYVAGKRLDGKPVYVLTSKHTFSGGEEFTYDLKELKRAVIIGETTGGGAHPVAGHRIDDRFMIGVPFATAVNPISHTSWEGTGVEPDVKVPADSALAVAEKLAADTLRVTHQ